MYRKLVLGLLALALSLSPSAAQKKDIPPELDEAMRNALSLLTQGQFTEAETALQEVLKKYPDTAVAWGSLGVAFQAEGKYEDAAQAYKKALEFDATRPIALYNLACVYSLMNEIDESFVWLDQVLDAGMTNVARLSQDPDLENARKDPRFEDILVRAGAPPCESREKYKELDFWVGQWDVLGPDGKKLGTSAVTKLMRDCALLESWEDAADGSHVLGLTYLDPGTKKWRQSWIGDRGSVVEYEGELQQGTMVFEGTNTSVNGDVERSRMALTPREDGTVERRIQQSKDGGDHWYLSSDASYVKKEDAPAAETP